MTLRVVVSSNISFQSDSMAKEHVDVPVETDRVGLNGNV